MFQALTRVEAAHTKTTMAETLVTTVDTLQLMLDLERDHLAELLASDVSGGLARDAAIAKAQSNIDRLERQVETFSASQAAAETRTR